MAYDIFLVLPPQGHVLMQDRIRQESEGIADRNLIRREQMS